VAYTPAYTAAAEAAFICVAYGTTEVVMRESSRNQPADAVVRTP